MEDIPIHLVEDNPFNTRHHYDEREIRLLAISLERNGLLCPVKLRRCNGRYQLVYGHRRLRALRLLNQKAVKAEIGDCTDEEMLKISLEENLMRRDLSDYEKALSFHRLNKEFGRTYDDIGKLTGYSKAHICNYIRMLRLFGENEFVTDPSLRFALHQITEHHARILLRVKDPVQRANALKILVSEKLSVRDLQRIIQRFRSWFGSMTTKDDRRLIIHDRLEKDSRVQIRDEMEIENILHEEFSLPHGGDFQTFAELHAFDKGFSLYPNFPPLERFEDKFAIDKHRNSFFSISPHLKEKLHDIKVQFFKEVALATLYVDYNGKVGAEHVVGLARGTVLFCRESNNWKIVHEHWSRIKEEKVMMA